MKKYRLELFGNSLEIYLCAKDTQTYIMVTDIFLSQEQIKQLRFNLRGHGAMEILVRRCDDKNICSRRTTFDALTHTRYDGENALHRLAANEAVLLLKENYGVTFPWAEMPEVIEA